MRILPFIAAAATTIALVFVLQTRSILPAPLGYLLSPQHGVWQNAEDVSGGFDANLKFPQLSGKVDVYFDERLVPHVFAEAENDVYFVQGYLHAKFRLWQMELQTHAAAGRASEIVGKVAFNHDREFRRLGMVSAAENSLKEMEKDPETKASCDAYTAGVNAYINQLRTADLPLEYKLIGYSPEPWSNLKTALFLKYMSFDLAGHEEDIEMTNARSFFSKEDFDILYPERQDSLDPVIPKGAGYPNQTVFPKAPAHADSLYFNNKDIFAVSSSKPDRNNGSNNWAVAGSKTASGAPILCNDPHLALNLPSLWYEIQLSTPTYNAYGVSFPGAPGVIIGYNDNCAFGFTNGGRDVRDYYDIRFKDDSHKEYWFDSSWHETVFRKEIIKIKGEPDFEDMVAYTVFGPVMFEKSFQGGRALGNKCLAVRWKAHDPSNELKIFTLLNKARDYNDYQAAVTNLHTPGQNCVFATKSGDIALRTQGEWPAKWPGQGDFVMPGIDSSYMWQGMIPQDEVPFQYNPERGFVSSANQKPADTSYPYYLGRDYPMYRGLFINKKLQNMTAITPKEMMSLQTNNDDPFAAMAKPVLLKYLDVSGFDNEESKFLNQFKNWNGRNDVRETGPTIFSIFWDHLEAVMYDDEFRKAPYVIKRPFESSLLEGMLRDSAYKFADNIETPEKETLEMTVTKAFRAAVLDLRKLAGEDRLAWGKYKGTHVSHLTKLEPFSRNGLPIGGGTHCINATRNDHGPSWRMVISLTAQTEAYGVYPGGQSGNPGSPFYDDFINHWVAGKYYTLWMMKKDEASSRKVKWHMQFGKS